jgi:hypothetical protein
MPDVNRAAVGMGLDDAPRSSSDAARASSGGASDPDPLLLDIRISLNKNRIAFEIELSGDTSRIGPHCWAMISEDLRLFAGRSGVDTRGLDLALPRAAGGRLVAVQE